MLLLGPPVLHHGRDPGRHGLRLRLLALVLAARSYMCVYKYIYIYIYICIHTYVCI